MSKNRRRNSKRARAVDTALVSSEVFAGATVTGWCCLNCSKRRKGRYGKHPDKDTDNRSEWRCEKAKAEKTDP